MKKIVFFSVFFLSILLVHSTPSFSKTVTIDISSPTGKNTLSISLAQPYGNVQPNYKEALEQSMLKDIKYVPFLRRASNYKIMYGPNTNIEFNKLEAVGIDLLFAFLWNSDGKNTFVEIRAFDVLSSSTIFKQTYQIRNQASIQQAADDAMSRLLQHLIGNGSLFKSRIFFVQKQAPFKYDLWSMFPNGSDLKQETNIQGLILSPNISPDGKHIVFAHLDRRRHTLAILDRSKRTIKRVVYPQGTSVISPTFTPKGMIAVALSFKGSPSIYEVDKNLVRRGKLIAGRSINVSPSFSVKNPDSIVFTSSMLGGPQIFIKNMQTGKVDRISTEGRYNTDASISDDGKYIAYVRMAKEGRRIYLYDTTTKRTRQITFGPGDDDTPAFAPDSYFIAFVSTRNKKSQLFLTTRQGTPAIVMPGKGNQLVLDPTWSLIN
ncbi:MAG: hypothetical protein ACRCV3_00500 [Desulfovibrionaceae bacterium]